jgi:uncharacterized protein YkwD
MRAPSSLLASLCLGGLLLLTACGSSTSDDLEGCVPADHPPSAGSMSGSENSDAMSVRTRINNYRATLPGPPDALVWDGAAAQIAYNHATDMMERNFFDQIGPDCWTVSDRAADAGIPYAQIVQHIAMKKANAAEVFDAWFASAGVRFNMANAAFTRIGVGKREGPAGPWWVLVLIEPPPP